METLIHKRVQLAQKGENPTVIGHMQSGWVVLGDIQNLRGYSLLLSDPVVGSINELSLAERTQFSIDMWTIGDALLAVTDSFRINYSILGNLDAALHAHINPRYRSEPDSTRGKMLPARFEHPIPFDRERDEGLMISLREYLMSKGMVIE